MYLAFNKKLECLGYQFEIGKTYEIKGDPILCGNGFHFCRDMQSCFEYYDMDSRICEVKAEEIVEGKDKSICRKITIIRELNKQEIIDRITDSKWAYYWARFIGNHEVMIDRITESEYAYLWARYIGNHEVMVDRITHEGQRKEIQKIIREKSSR